MSKSYKPEGYSTVSPYLIVDGVARTMRFLASTFDAESLLQIPGPDGKILHAEARIGDTVIMMTDGTETWQPLPSHVHVYVADVDETYRRALKAGATSVQEPAKKSDPAKRGAVRDSGGTTWWIATKVE
jgi:PhnB protein